MRTLRVLALLALSGPAFAQAPAPPTVPASPAPAAPAASSDYEVGPGDVLEVVVLENPELSRVATVQTSGVITVPLLGEVPVSGLSMAEVQRKLTTLLARDYLVNPRVEVSVKEYQSQFATVLGEVNSPGRKPLRGRTRLVDVLIEAGGFTARASGEVAISRREGTFDGGQSTVRIRLSGAQMTPQDQVNLELPLRNGDIVTAAPKYYFTVDGEVSRPGRFTLEADMTVTGALSTAGGLTRFASSTVKVRRTDASTGQTRILEVNLKDVRNGKQADVTLEANDAVSVPRRLF
jgi:polysaccharide export outer membrane protein